MRRTIGVVAAMLLAGPAMAQTGKKAAKPAEPPPAPDATQASAPPPTAAPTPTPAPSTGKVTIAPPEEAGWTVVELPGGYYRYRTEDVEPGEGGGVTVSPPEPAHGALAPRQAPPAAAPQETPPPPPAMNAGYEAAPGAPACEQERGILNQRLYELRGLNVDPASANALADSERPLQASAWANVPGYGPGLGSFLVTAAQSDTPTRERLAEYARCVERSQGR